MDLFTEGSIFMHYGLAGLKLKCHNDRFDYYKHSFSLHKMLTNELQSCGLLWIIVMFVSAVWALILTAPIHCRGSIGEQEM